MARLSQVRGVGEWTVHMLLIFRLGRPDVWPTLDYGVRHGDIRPLTVSEGMSRNPKSVAPSAMAVEAATLMDANRLTQLLVVDPAGALVGALHMHDLLAAKVI